MKAGLLIKGQDSVRRELKRGSRLLVLLTADHSENVASMLEGYRQRGRCRVFVMDTWRRDSVHEGLPVGQTQILALPADNGLAAKIEMLVTKGVAADEQD